jgi:predicted ribosome quality control (RQC) complex YloA/Tae2 family protein
MLSLVELQRVTPLLEALIGDHRVQKIVQTGPLSVALTTYGGPEARRRHVRLSCRPGSARVSQLTGPPKAAGAAGGFAQYLRAHIDGARVSGVRLLDNDRQLALRLVGAEGEFDLLLCILGPRSNLLLLDPDGGIQASLRPLSETRPELAAEGRWESPASRPPSAGEDRFAEIPDAELLRAIEARYADAESSDAAAELERRLAQALTKEAKALDRKLAKLEQSLEDARDASRLQREGELLKSVLAEVKRGDTQVVARDFDSGEPVTIALDPKLGPSDNLSRLFKKYQKAVRSLTKAGARHDAVGSARAALAVLRERFDSLSGSGDAEALRGFADKPEVAKLVAKYTKSAGAAPSRAPRTEQKLGKHTVPNRLMPRRYRTSGGLEIWVGRSAAGNDHLSIRLARGKDLFFHLDGAPGSHVILRTEGRADPPSEAILDACELAVHFSKQKNASRADVHAVPIANVRKPKGAKPGLVTVHGGKTIHLRRTETRLQRILEARIEE